MSGAFKKMRDNYFFRYKARYYKRSKALV